MPDAERQHDGGSETAVGELRADGVLEVGAGERADSSGGCVSADASATFTDVIITPVMRNVMESPTVATGRATLRMPSAMCCPVTRARYSGGEAVATRWAEVNGAKVGRLRLLTPPPLVGGVTATPQLEILTTISSR